MSIHSIVLEQNFGANKAGEVIPVDEELAKALIDSGIAREATAEDIGDDDEEEAPEEVTEEEDSPDMVQEQAETFRRNAEAEARKVAAQEVRKAVKQSIGARPNLAAKVPVNRHVAGSDEARTGGFKSLGDAVQSYMLSRKGDYAAQKKFARWGALSTKVTANTISGGSGHEGGDLVPQQWAEDLWRLSFANVPDLLGSCLKYEMRNQTENIPIWTQTSHSSGIVASVVAENTQGTVTKFTTATQQLTLNKGMILCDVTDELLRFSPYNVESTIKAVAPERIRFLTNDSVVNGSNNGANLVNCAAAVTVLRAANNVLSYADITNMYASLWDSYADEAVWLTNRSSLPSLLGIKFPDNSGSYPAWAAGVFGSENLLGPKPKMSLLGLPVYTVENCPAITARGGLILYAPKTIAAGYMGPFADSTPYLYFDYAVNTFRFLLYFDSVNHLTAPYTRADNSQASNVVVLSATTSS